MRSTPRLHTEDQNEAVVSKFVLLYTTGKHNKYTPVHKLHVAFKIPYVYNNIPKLCTTQAEVILNHETQMY
jgi:hypothetical protein